MEKAASGASGKSRYSEYILSQISGTLGWGWRKKSWKWRIELGQRRFEVGECGNEDLELKIEGGGLLIDDGQSRFEDSIMPHQYLKHIFLCILCRESRYFEDNVNIWIFRLRMIYNFFQVWILTLIIKTKRDAFESKSKNGGFMLNPLV